MPQYIPPQSLTDFLKIKNHDEVLLNPVLKPETNEIQVKTSSLLISTKTTDSVNRNSSEFQQVVQTSKETAQLKHKLKQFGIKFDPKQNRLISPVEGFRPDRNPQPRHRRRNLPGNSPQVPPKFAPRIITNLGANNDGDHGNDDWNPNNSNNLNIPVPEQPQHHIPPKKKPEITKIKDWAFDDETDNPFSIRSRQEVEDLLEKNGYNTKMPLLGSEFFVNEHQLLKKNYHAKEFGADLKEYDMSPEMLKHLNKYRRIFEYLGRGGEIPPPEFFIDYKKGLEDFLKHPATKIVPGYHVQGDRVIEVNLAYNTELEILLCANRASKDFIGGQKVESKQFNFSVDTDTYLATKNKMELVNKYKAQKQSH